MDAGGVCGSSGEVIPSGRLEAAVAGLNPPLSGAAVTQTMRQGDCPGARRPLVGRLAFGSGSGEFGDKACIECPRLKVT